MRGAADPYLTLESVSKRYRDVIALERVSFGTRRGEIFGYIGPNGAGKTTTIKIMVGLIHDFQGAVAIDGHSVVEERERIQRILGYLPQRAAFQEWRTVDQALSTFGRLSGLSRQDLASRIPEVLELVGIPEARHRKIVQLSGGTVQKVGMAQAILHAPELLILDEPMSGLDPASRYQFKEIFKELRKAGTTIFFSSHILSDVQDIANRIGILNRGRTMHVGTLEELKARLRVPRDIYVVLSQDSGRWSELSGLPGIGGIEQPEPNHLLIHVASDASMEDAVEVAFDGLRRAGCRIRSISPVSPDLEELYVRFVSEGVGG